MSNTAEEQQSGHSTTGKGVGLMVNVARMLLAVVFIFSGFVKAVDPLGTQYKIRDYLEAMHIGGLLPDVATLVASVCLSAVEFCLGIFLLFATASS